jgi:hypothetical protein
MKHDPTMTDYKLLRCRLVMYILRVVELNILFILYI